MVLKEQYFGLLIMVRWFKLYDSEGGYIGSFPSWQSADNYRWIKGNKYWKIK